MSETMDNLAALAADVESALSRRRSASAAAISWFREAALLPVLAALIIVGAVLNSNFLTVSNITGIGQQISALGVVDGIVKGQSPYNLPGAFSYLGSANVGRIPVSLIVAVVIFIVAGLFLRYHRVGRAIYAIGGNREAARAAGIKVNRVRIGVYVAGSVLAAIGGLMEAGRVSSVVASQGYGEGIIFAVFAAAVIDGAVILVALIPARVIGGEASAE
jgi:simple sugar transport system permease protein